MMRGGPISISEYMQDCLTSPQGGFYMNRDVFGRAGDFITSPEISQLFGEMVGIWCVHTWMMMGRPSRLMLVEMGPGRGTLMADLLRGTAAFRDFSSSLEVHLVELSPALRQLQWGALHCRPLGPGPGPAPRAEPGAGAAAGAAAPGSAGPGTGPGPGPGPGPELRPTAGPPQAPAPGPPPLLGVPPLGGKGPAVGATQEAGVDPAAGPHAGICGLNGCRVFWHPSLDAVPEGPAPALYIAHEFFDALPVHQFVRDPARGWLEKMVDVVQPDEEQQEAEPSRRPPSDGSTTGGPASGDGGGPATTTSGTAGSPSESASHGSDGGVGGGLATSATGTSPGGPATSATGTSPGGGGEGQGGAGPGAGSTSSGSGLRLVLSPGPTPAAALLVPRRLAGLTREEADKVKAIEISAVGMATAERLAHRIARHGGAALVVDYGREGLPYEDSVMAIRGHRGVEILDDPGSADLSAWVDFGALRQAALGAPERPAGSAGIITPGPVDPRPAGSAVATSGPVTQGAFLRGLGIETRLQWLAGRAKSPEEAEALAAGCARLLGAPEEGGMGTSYKVMAIHDARLKDMAGLSP